MQKKLITEKSEEELLELLQNMDSNEESNDYKNDVLDFISFYSFKQGSEKVQKSLLYNLYLHWSENPISRYAFGKEITNCFESENQYIGINRTAVAILKKVYQIKKPRRKIVSKKWKQHFDNYLKHYNIKSGTFFVKTEVLYNLYDKWTYKNSNKNPLGIEQFRSFCHLYFKVKIARHYTWFGVNRSIFAHLNEELINELLRKKVNKNVKKEKNKKITI